MPKAVTDVSSAGFPIQRFVALMEHADWNLCPSCIWMNPGAPVEQHQWLELRLCEYYEGSKTRVAEVCVQCAESVQAIPWLNENWPITGVQYDFKQAPGYLRTFTTKIYEQSWFPNEPEPPFRFRADVVRSRHLQRALVWIDSMKYELSSKATGPYMVIRNANKPDEVVELDNAIQAWLSLKARFEKGETAEMGNAWPIIERRQDSRKRR